MPSVEIQTEEEYTVIDDPDYYTCYMRLIVKNGIFIFSEAITECNNYSKSTMTIFNSDDDYDLNFTIKNLISSGDY